ncbi:VanW family protein [Jeotgalibacillus sp. ET6]|uniref:VanW family protein n=1 Tax=Jeotgalibacillus sp. ET6 TaxID=3037260 RepID=UPI00241866FF|nr:VanW family protein [Jeotgalibacillus sp. ET6]MDG5470962.1 VanW family protein [Jeotgalibacillus sp. ET6]
MGNSQIVKLLLTGFLSFFIIYGTSQAGPKILPGLPGGTSVFEEDTQIGGVDVGGMSKDEAVIALIDDTQTWKEQASLEIAENEQTSPVELSLLHFLIEESVEAASDHQSNPLKVKLDIQEILIGIEQDLSVPASEWVDPAKLQFEIEKNVQILFSEETVTIPLTALLPDDKEQSIIAEEAGDFTLSGNQQLFVEEHKIVPIESGGTFSILSLAAAYGEEFLTDEEFSQLASVIHGAVIDSPLTVTERSISLSLPAWAERGKEAKVERESSRDYQFMNASSAPVTMEMEIVQQSLYVRIKGQQHSHTYEAVTGDIQTIKPKIINQYSPFVQSNVTRISEEGSDGYLIPVYQRVLDAAGAEVEKNLLYEDFYPPVHRVEIKSLERPEIRIEKDDSPSVSVDSENTEDGSGSDDEQNTDISEDAEEGQSSDASSASGTQADPADGEVPTEIDQKEYEEEESDQGTPQGSEKDENEEDK